MFTICFFSVHHHACELYLLSTGSHRGNDARAGELINECVKSLHPQDAVRTAHDGAVSYGRVQRKSFGQLSPKQIFDEQDLLQYCSSII